MIAWIKSILCTAKGQHTLRPVTKDGFIIGEICTYCGERFKLPQPTPAESEE